jgi:TRAP-type C4-dicarboxylate transport system permease small subunit
MATRGEIGSVQMKLLMILDRAISRLSDAGLAISALTMLFIALFGAADVLTTFVASRPLPIARELSGELLTLLIFGSMARVTRDRRHIEVDLVITHVGRGVQFLSRCVGLATGAVVFALFAYRAVMLAAHSYQTGEFAAAIIRFPIWPIKITFAAVLCIACLEFLRQLAWSLADGPSKRATSLDERNAHG